MRAAATLLGLAAAWFAAGCGSVPYDDGRLLDEPALGRQMQAYLDHVYPERFTVVQRSVLTRGDSQSALTLGVNVDRPADALEMAALTDIGATVFKARWSASAGAEVMANPVGMPKRAITHVYLPDAVRLYLRPAVGDGLVVGHDDGQVGLLCARADGWFEEFRFDREPLRLRAYVQTRKGRQRYRIDFPAEPPLEGGLAHTPRRAQIHSFRYGYTADVTLSRIDARPPADDAP